MGLYRPDIDVDVLSLLRVEQIVLVFRPDGLPCQKVQHDACANAIPECIF